MGLNPQQQAFKEAYTNPNSETFGNAYQSALSAGYSENYATDITAPTARAPWVEEIMDDLERLQKAEKVLSKALTFIDDRNPEKQRMALDTAKFVAARMGKQKYSERQEFTGANGKDLPTPIYGGKAE